MAGYEEFDDAYGRVLAAAGTLDDTALADELSRLRALRLELVDPADRERAAADIATLEDIAAIPADTLSPARRRALEVYSAAGSETGTPSDRLLRVRAGIAEIVAIAETAAPDERAAILDLTESLSLLADSLAQTRPDRR